jgi:choline-glycine betaine transporter
MGVRLPWWRLATLALLIGALVLAIANGRTIEAVIIGVLLVPTLVVLGVWVYYRASPTQRRIALKYAQPMPEHDTYMALMS